VAENDGVGPGFAFGQGGRRVGERAELFGNQPSSISGKRGGWAIATWPTTSPARSSISPPMPRSAQLARSFVKNAQAASRVNGPSM